MRFYFVDEVWNEIRFPELFQYVVRNSHRLELDNKSFEMSSASAMCNIEIYYEKLLPVRFSNNKLINSGNMFSRQVWISFHNSRKKKP
ncbi:hypothetical protein Y032_0530g3010 [Ancylostoma ceylanicum]|uniref:Uncharacterized protein n=1 Tax=Ancylostoma ceylanicum TaxID=53326 RepID=A0A016WTY8_9BILA|nr:hypothetical protein Y032_0530g3010 [Ancylostoma ceylanicum]